MDSPLVGVRTREASDCLPELYDFDGTIRPVVLPADQQITMVRIVSVESKIIRFEFKLYVHGLVKPASNFAFRSAIWIGTRYSFHDEAQIFGHHAEEKNYPLLVDGLMAKFSKV